MNDIDGNEVEVGDLIRVLSIDSDFLGSLNDETERAHHLAMLNNSYFIDEIVENGSKASVSIQWQCVDGIATGGLYLLPSEFRLEKRTDQPQTTRAVRQEGQC
jgi:hypothetical protein